MATCKSSDYRNTLQAVLMALIHKVQNDQVVPDSSPNSDIAHDRYLVTRAALITDAIYREVYERMENDGGIVQIPAGRARSLEHLGMYPREDENRQ